MKRVDMTQAIREVAAFTYKATPERRIALLAWAKSHLEACDPVQREAYDVAVAATCDAIDARNRQGGH